MQVMRFMRMAHVYITAWEYCFFNVHLVTAFGDADRLMDVRHKSHVFFVYIPFFMFVNPASTFAGKLTIASEPFFVTY